MPEDLQELGVSLCCGQPANAKNEGYSAALWTIIQPLWGHNAAPVGYNAAPVGYTASPVDNAAPVGYDAALWSYGL